MKNKTSDIRHELLSELHYLLSIASAQDFLDASSLCKSENIKSALESLAKEHNGNVSVVPSTEARKYKKAIPTRVKPGKDSAAIRDNDMQVLLSDVSRFPRKQDLQDFAKSNGISFKVNVKESREREVSKLVKILLSLPQDRLQTIKDRLAEGFDSQTAGWARVLKRPS